MSIRRRKPLWPPAVVGGGGSPYAHSNFYEFSDNAVGVASCPVANVVIPAGALVIVTVSFDSAANPTGTVGDGTNAYNQIGTGVHDGTQYGMRSFYAYNATGGTYTITWIPGVNVNYPAIWVDVFTGIRTASDPLTGTPSFGNQATPGTGTDGVTSGNTTPGGQPALVYGFGFDVLGSTPAPAAGTGYTSPGTGWNYEAAISNSARSEHKRVTSTSATAATFTAGVNERHFSFVAAFLEP